MIKNITSLLRRIPMWLRLLILLVGLMMFFGWVLLLLYSMVGS